MIKSVSKTIREKLRTIREIEETKAAYEEYLDDLAKLDLRAHLRVIDGGRSDA